MSETGLDCYGKDSANADCWPDAVNIAVPIVVVVVWVGLLVIMFVTWPKRPPEDDLKDNPNTDNGVLPQRWQPREKDDITFDLTVVSDSTEGRSRSTSFSTTKSL